MKKILMILVLMVVSLPCFAIENVGIKSVQETGFKILNANKIDKRVVFKYVYNVKSPYFVGYSHSWKPERANLAYTDRTITVFGDTLALADSEDELSAILSQEIAQALDSYNGTFRGFFSSTRYELDPKKYETKADLKAVDYMVNAGYNPVALIVMYNKSLGQTRYEWCHYYPLTSKRMMKVYEYIHSKYPQYLADDKYKDNIYYINFLLTSKSDMQKFEKKINRVKR